MAKRVVPSPFPAPFVATPEQFGAAVRAARTASGMTLEEAALALGVAKQTLQSLERGTSSVGLALALRIAQALGVAVLVAPASRRRVLENLVRPQTQAGSGDSGAERS